ncbi:transcription termination/antitermination protein NusG [Sinisalibacter aestuarii]|uniref:Transcription termination/antitermination protein NusG n=1 Tax=Sinisalibacter aestuarii TaxID=2949426 RepID=A0ABQ5LW65_9RHOB|nr:transcription termination/antitermination NusG family protein [Sinisalibacter aestuarii]GKY89221.1 transcription antitermination protein RfaH [Sinisalibacter aestuarii]
MSAQPREEDWYLAQLKPNALRIAERNLHRQGFRTFLPQVEETKRRGGRFETALKPLFPGYVFVAFDATLGGWRAINATQGITRLVGLGRGPVAVHRGIMDALRARCDAQGILLPGERLREGQGVRITAGPFADFVATIERITPDRRAWVLLELMGRETRVAVPTDGLRPA